MTTEIVAVGLPVGDFTLQQDTASQLQAALVTVIPAGFLVSCCTATLPITMLQKKIKTEKTL